VDDIIPLMAEGKILPYLDIPFQHGSPGILRAMRRPAAAEDTLKRIATWRKICLDIAIRSTFIVGFPGESEEDFQTLLDFLEEAQLDRVGCFEYSSVAGAKANELEHHVPDEVKAERMEQFMTLQARISAEKLKSKIGKKIDVLIDDLEKDNCIGRSHADAPEIDGVVYIENPPENLKSGEIIQVWVTGATEHDVYALAI